MHVADSFHVKSYLSPAMKGLIMPNLVGDLDPNPIYGSFGSSTVKAERNTISMTEEKKTNWQITSTRSSVGALIGSSSELESAAAAAAGLSSATLSVLCNFLQLVIKY